MRLLDLKYAIVEKNKLDQGMDFDLIVTNADTNERYFEDKFHVPRNTRVIIKRAPAGPAGGLIQRLSIMRMKDQKDTMVRHGTLETTLPISGAMTLGAEFSSKRTTNGSTSATTVEATANTRKYDPRMMDSSDEEDEDADTTEGAGVEKIDDKDQDAQLLADLEKQQEEEAAQIKSLAQTAENTRQMEIRVSNSVRNSMRGRRRGPWRAHVRNPVHGAAAKEDEALQNEEEKDSAPIWGGLATTEKSKNVDGNGDNDQADEANPIPKQFRCPFTKKILVDAVNLPCCGATVSKVAAKEKLAKANNTCPLCGTEDVKTSNLQPNKILRGAVSRYIQKKSELGATMDDNALKEFTNVDAEDVNNALGDLNGEEVADVGLKINVNKLKKDDPLKDEKEENKPYNEEETSLILSDDLYQDTEPKAANNKEQVGMGASGTGNAEMGGYGAPEPENLGGYGVIPNDLGGYGATNTNMGGYGSSAATLGGYGATVPSSAQNLGGYGSYVPPSVPGNTGGYGANSTGQSTEVEKVQPRRKEDVDQNMPGSTFVEVDKRRCYKCGEVGHMANSCPYADSTLKCFVCKKTGHLAKNCPETKCYACGKRGHMATQCPNPIPKHLREDYNQGSWNKGSWNRGSYDRPRLYNDHRHHGNTGRSYQRSRGIDDADYDSPRDGYNEMNNGRAPDNNTGDDIKTDGDAGGNEYSTSRGRSISRERSRERSQDRYRESSRSRGRSTERSSVRSGDNENNNRKNPTHRRRWSPDDRNQGISDQEGSNRGSRWSESTRPHKARWAEDDSSSKSANDGGGKDQRKSRWSEEPDSSNNPSRKGDWKGHRKPRWSESDRGSDNNFRYDNDRKRDRSGNSDGGSFFRGNKKSRKRRRRGR